MDKTEKGTNRFIEHIPWIIGTLAFLFVSISAKSVMHEMLAVMWLIYGFLNSIFIRLGRIK